MTVQIHGNPYVTVAERLQMVHESGKPFEVVSSEPLQAGDRWLWRVAIKVDGLLYTGSAEAKIANARAGSPDSSNPFECAETSALGRALGFAGYGAIESIASADEIVRSQPRTTHGNSARMNALFAKGKAAGRWTTPQEMLAQVSEILETEITRDTVGQLDDSLLDLVENELDGDRF